MQIKPNPILVEDPLETARRLARYATVHGHMPIEPASSKSRDAKEVSHAVHELIQRALTVSNEESLFHGKGGIDTVSQTHEFQKAQDDNPYRKFLPSS